MKTLLATVAALLGGLIAVPVVVSGPAASDSPPSPSAMAISEIPAGLLDVFQHAAATCGGLPWQVLAAISWVESHHGAGRYDPATGNTSPPILGPALDGRGGTARLADPASPDGWAHARGPMQFLPGTWAAWARVAPERGPSAVASIDNAWDAAYTAAAYLCAGRPAIDNLADAIASFNHSDAYVDAVLAKADDYTATDTPDTGVLVGGDGAAVVAAAASVIGVPYVYAGSSPETGFDCSGLVVWAYHHVGVNLPRTTFDQVRKGVAVTVEQLAPGDLIFSRGGRAGEIRDFGHVAIYAGGGQEIAAPHTGAFVRYQPIDPPHIQAIRRILQPQVPPA